MALKVLLVTAEGTGPGKKNLADVINQEVASFSAKEKVEVTDVRIEANMRSGGYGEALVTVSFNKDEKKK